MNDQQWIAVDALLQLSVSEVIAVALKATPQASWPVIAQAINVAISYAERGATPLPFDVLEQPESKGCTCPEGHASHADNCPAR